MPKIEIYTDGSCKPTNPGPAGLGVVLFVDDKEEESISSYIGKATNNIAELKAINIALSMLERREWEWEESIIYTDSQYAIGLFTKNWNPKANQELVAEIRNRLENFPNLNFQWVRGHDGNERNELADQLANQAVDSAVPDVEVYCCEVMESQLEHNCEEHADKCPDRVVIKGESGLLLSAPNATYDLFYCPWCGHKVQEPDNE